MVLGVNFFLTASLNLLIELKPAAYEISVMLNLELSSKFFYILSLVFNKSLNHLSLTPSIAAKLLINILYIEALLIILIARLTVEEVPCHAGDPGLRLDDTVVCKDDKELR